MKKAKIIFELEVDLDDLSPEDVLEEDYNNDWLTCVKTLLGEHGLAVEDLSQSSLEPIEVRINEIQSNK